MTFDILELCIDHMFWILFTTSFAFCIVSLTIWRVGLEIRNDPLNDVSLLQAECLVSLFTLFEYASCIHEYTSYRNQ